MKSTYKRITLEQRISIEKFLALGKTYEGIAFEIGCHKSSVWRDVRRCKKNKYSAITATCLAVGESLNRRHGKCKIVHNKELGEFVLKKLGLHWSPEQIHLHLKKNYPNNKAMNISMESIYFYIYVHVKPELKKVLIEQLRQKRIYRGNQRRGKDKRTTIRNPIRIDERPEEVKGRLIPGHWEGNLIMGKDHNSAIGTLNERSSRTVIIVHLKAKGAASVRKAFEKEFKSISSQMRKSLTYDNGSEMAQHELFTKNTKIDVYFARPYSPWGTSYK